MDRRELLGVLGAGAAGLVAFGGSAARAGAQSDEHEEHIKIIGHCALVCNEAAHHCLEELKKGGPHAAHHVKSHEAAMDCQAFCVLAATMSARRSPMAKYAHAACAEACGDCAAACAGQDAKIMTECAEACLACEKICKSMSVAAH